MCDLISFTINFEKQAEVVKMHTDLKAGKYWGEMGVDYWNAADWKKEQGEFEVSIKCVLFIFIFLRKK